MSIIEILYRINKGLEPMNCWEAYNYLVGEATPSRFIKELMSAGSIPEFVESFLGNLQKQFELEESRAALIEALDRIDVKMRELLLEMKSIDLTEYWGDNDGLRGLW